MDSPEKQAGLFQTPLGQGSAALRGFSLVEVVLALAIISIVMVSLVGMLPVGLTTFRGSSTRTISVQISQRILNESRQAGFSNLSAMPQIRYFTEEGDETTATSPTKIYVARTDVIIRVIVPGTGSAFSNASLAQVRVRVAVSPTGDVSATTVAGPGVQDFTGFVPKM